MKNIPHQTRINVLIRIILILWALMQNRTQVCFSLKMTFQQIFSCSINSAHISSEESIIFGRSSTLFFLVTSSSTLLKAKQQAHQNFIQKKMRHGSGPGLPTWKGKNLVFNSLVENLIILITRVIRNLFIFITRVSVLKYLLNMKLKGIKLHCWIRISWLLVQTHIGYNSSSSMSLRSQFKWDFGKLCNHNVSQITFKTHLSLWSTFL